MSNSAKGLDLLLVNPSNRTQMYGNLGPSLSAVEPPLWTGLLASFIREKNFTVKIIDADAEGWDAKFTSTKILEYNPLLLGVSAIGINPSASSTPKMAAASKLLEILKEKAPHIKTFLYGIHPSALPERTLKEEPVDFVLRGECFYTILELLKILKSGRDIFNCNIKGLWYKRGDEIISNEWGRMVESLNELPLIAWDMLPMDKYRAHNWHCFGRLNQRQPYAIIYTSLGCPFNCRYCNIHALYSGSPGVRFRDIAKVVDEIDYLVENYNVRNIKILDELFVLREDRVAEFCDLVIEREYGLNMWAYARVDTVNERILKKMKMAGINWLCYGIESASKKVRDSVSKGRFDQKAVKKAMDMAHGAGIYIIGNFMFGLPDDDLQTMQETLQMAKDIECEYVNFYVTMAYPGSELYEDASRQGVDLPETWLGYSQLSEETLPLPNKRLSSADILRFRDKAFKEYYSDHKYLKMIQEKFGLEAVESIKEMLRYRIQRRLLEDVKEEIAS